MKKLLLFLCIFVHCSAEAESHRTAAKPTLQPMEEDKVYTVPETKPEILIGASAPALKKLSGKRPEQQNYVGIVRGSLNYDLPAYNHTSLRFKPNFAGLSLAHKKANQFYIYEGNIEIGGEWQGFKREQGLFSQKLNIFQVNLFQNFNLAWSFRHPVFFSSGIGVSPVYLTAEKSVFGNSLSTFGAMGLIKFDFIFPFKVPYEIDFALKGGWGSLGGREIFLSNICLGINYE